MPLRIGANGELVLENKEFGDAREAISVEAGHPYLGGRTSKEAQRSTIVRKKGEAQRLKQSIARKRAAQKRDRDNIDSLRKEIVDFKRKKRNETWLENKKAKQILTAKRGKYADIPLVGNEFAGFEQQGMIVCDKNLKGDNMSIETVGAFGNDMSMSDLGDSGLGRRGFRRPSVRAAVRRAAPVRRIAAKAAPKRLASPIVKIAPAPKVLKAVSKAGMKVTPAPLKAAAKLATTPITAPISLVPSPKSILKNPKEALNVKKAALKVKGAATKQIGKAAKLAALANKLNFLKSKGASEEEVSQVEEEIVQASAEETQAAADTTQAAIEQKVEETNATQAAAAQVDAGKTTFVAPASVASFKHPLG